MFSLSILGKSPDTRSGMTAIELRVSLTGLSSSTRQ